MIYTLTPTVLTRIIAAEQRVRYFTLLSVALMSGFGLSPVMASLLENRGFSNSHLFFLMSVLCLLGGILYFSLQSLIRRLSENAGKEPRSSLSLSNILTINNSKALLPAMMVWIGASVFAGMHNLQTVIADERNLNYADFFLAYTITVVICRVLLATYQGQKISLRHYSGSAIHHVHQCCFIPLGRWDQYLYILVAILFGIGYGATHPLLVAMTYADADSKLLPQTMQLLALTYFIGIFGFAFVDA